MTASILSLATAVPPYILKQALFVDTIGEVLSFDAEKIARLKKLYAHTAIDKRHFVLPDFLLNRSERTFWNKDYPHIIPGTAQRNNVYIDIAPKLALEAASKAIAQWKGDKNQISHVISVSCTGLFAPGIEFELVQALKLQPSVCRLGINFMGCYGAFKGLAIANAFAAQNPEHRILVVCTELCSLHLQAKDDLETLMGNAIFADGAAAIIVGAGPTASEHPLWDIIKTHSHCLEDTKDKITWQASDQGFQMQLSKHVPVLLKRHIKPFVDSIIGAAIDYAACDFAIHPGGKSILQAVEKAMSLTSAQTKASWETLAGYGNMSSATFLFVLDRLLNLNTTNKWTVGLGFGPGLGIEGVLLQKSSTHAYKK